MSSYKIDGFKHSFNALSDKFGHLKPFEDVFELFGEFEKGHNDVLFDVSFIKSFSMFKICLTLIQCLQDDATSFVTEQNGIDLKTYKKLRCLD